MKSDTMAGRQTTRHELLHSTMLAERPLLSCAQGLHETQSLHWGQSLHWAQSLHWVQGLHWTATGKTILQRIDFATAKPKKVFHSFTSLREGTCKRI